MSYLRAQTELEGLPRHKSFGKYPYGMVEHKIYTFGNQNMPYICSYIMLQHEYGILKTIVIYTFEKMKFGVYIYTAVYIYTPVYMGAHKIYVYIYTPVYIIMVFNMVYYFRKMLSREVVKYILLYFMVLKIIYFVFYDPV